MHSESSLKHYQQVRERLYRTCEELARLATATGVDVIEDPHIESWVTLGAGETASPPYHRRPLAQLISTRADMLRKPFRVAVMGEFSRGKSTLINALLGKELLISDFRPNTAVCTTIRASTPQRICVHFLSGQEPYVKETDDIPRYLASVTSDASFGDNQQGLLVGTRKSLAQQYKEVEVYADLQFLREREMELIDTPGLGSVFESHQAVAYSIISSADMVLYVVQYDPGIGAEDLDFLTSVREQRDHFLFLLTKCDLARTPAKVQEMIGFIRDALRERVGIQHPKIYPVSAAFALNERYAESGITGAILSIEDGLVAISGIRRIQETLRFTNTCTIWLDIALYRGGQNLERFVQLQNQHLEMLTLRTNQTQHLQNVMHGHIKSSFATLLADLNESIKEVPHSLQHVAEEVINHLEPEEFATVGQQVIEALQTAVNRWLQEKQKQIRSQATRVLEHISQIITPISPHLSGHKADVQVNYISIALSKSALLSLFPGELPGIVGISARLGASSALRTARTGYKQRLLEPIAHQQVSIYQITLDGINFTLMENKQQRQITIKGIRRELEAAFAQTCKSLETHFELSVDAGIRPYLSHLSQAREKILQEQETIKKQIGDLSHRHAQLDVIKQRTIEIDQESKNIVPV